MRILLVEDDRMVGAAVTQALKDGGLAQAAPISKVYDPNGAFGGPLKQGRAWYFINARTQGSTRVTANQFYNFFSAREI